MLIASSLSVLVMLFLQAEAYRLQLARFYELLVEQKAPRGTAPRIAGLRNVCKELRKVSCCATPDEAEVPVETPAENSLVWDSVRLQVECAGCGSARH